MDELRERMIKRREKYRISRKKMALKCGCSEKLLQIIEEEDGVTRPNIAKRIGLAYGLTELEIEELMPINYRPHGGDYEPDRYLHEIHTTLDPDRALKEEEFI